MECAMVSQCQAALAVMSTVCSDDNAFAVIEQTACAGCSSDGFVLQATGTCPLGTTFIETDAGCAAAATSLGLSSTAVSEWDSALNGKADRPHGCYFLKANRAGKQLWRNPNGDENYNDTDRVSLCKCIGSKCFASQGFAHCNTAGWESTSTAQSSSSTEAVPATTSGSSKPLQTNSTCTALKQASHSAKAELEAAVAEEVKRVHQDAEEAKRADQAARDEAKLTAFALLGGIGGVIVILSIVHYARSPPERRSIDLYIMVTGGLLDFTSDGMYVPRSLMFS